MIVIGILLNILAIGFACWLLFTLAVYALPFFAGLMAAFAAYHGGSSVIGAIMVGVLAGTVTLGIGQAVFTLTRSLWLRAVIALLYAAPATIAGYHATLGLAHIGVPSPTWQQIFALIGAMAVGVTAWTRMTLLAEPVGVLAPAATQSSLPVSSSIKDA